MSDSDLVTVINAAAAGRVDGGRSVERAPFVIVEDMPGQLAAQPQAGPGSVVVFGCARPPTGQHPFDEHVHVFLLAAGDPLPPMWTAWCGHEIGDTQLEVLNAGMGTLCPGCHQHWASPHHQDTGLPVRAPGQHPRLRRRP